MAPNLAGRELCKIVHDKILILDTSDVCSCGWKSITEVALLDFGISFVLHCDGTCRYSFARLLQTANMQINVIVKKFCLIRFTQNVTDMICNTQPIDIFLIQYMDISFLLFF